MGLPDAHHGGRPDRPRRAAGRPVAGPDRAGLRRDPGADRARPRRGPRPTPTSRRCSTRLADLGVRVAVVTGRPAALAVEYGGLRTSPAWSSWATTAPSAGRTARSPRPATTPAWTTYAGGCPACSRSCRRPEGTFVEDKGARGRGAHPTYRRPGCRLRPAARAARPGWPRRPAWSSSRAGTCSSCGRPAATRATRCGPSWGRRRPSVVVFVGDDLGDLPAFARSTGCATRACPGCWSAAAPPR